MNAHRTIRRLRSSWVAAIGATAANSLTVFGTVSSAAAAPSARTAPDGVAANVAAQKVKLPKLPWHLHIPHLDFGPKKPGKTTLSPQATYDALLKAAFKSGELPSGFTSPDVQKYESSYAKGFNVLGTVLVETNGPDADNAIFYYVFNNGDDAKTFYTDGTTSRSEGTTAFFAPSGFNQPAGCERLNGTSSGTAFGLTRCYVLVGNVVVMGTSYVEGANLQGGKDANAITITHAGITHLQSVQGGN
jgi:hypothetical protein